MEALDKMDKMAAAVRAAEDTGIKLIATTSHANAWAISQFLAISPEGQVHMRRMIDAASKLDKGE